MTVSVLIPSHNRADLHRRTLASFRDVNVPEEGEVKVIVTANACTDGTVEMLEGLAADYPLPFRFFHEKTLGANIARNRCLREARGDILAFVEDDIQFDPGWLNGLTDVFENTTADVVGGRIKLWWEVVGRPEWMNDEFAHILSAYDLGDEVKQVGLPGPVGANMALHRRDDLKEVGGSTGPFRGVRNTTSISGWPWRVSSLCTSRGRHTTFGSTRARIGSVSGRTRSRG